MLNFFLSRCGKVFGTASVMLGALPNTAGSGWLDIYSNYLTKSGNGWILLFFYCPCKYYNIGTLNQHFISSALSFIH